MPMTEQQLEIFDHTVQRAARGLFCGDSPAMQELVAAGLMESAGRVAWCPDEYFRITPAGREAWRAAQPERRRSAVASSGPGAATRLGCGPIVGCRLGSGCGGRA